MTLKIADRVKETSTTAGTGTLNLAGAAIGFQTFVAGVGNGNTCFYAISHQTASEWEVGIGTVADASPDTLARTTVLQSSNSDNAVNFAAGTKDVFVTYPAGKAVYKDATGKVGIGTESPSYTLDVREARAGYDSWVQSSGVRVGPSGTVLLDADLSRSITVKAPDVVSTSFTLPLPSGIGSNGQVLTTDSKNTYWSTVSGGSSLTVGSDNQIPYTNGDGDDFDYSANLTWGHGSNKLTIDGDLEIAAKLFHKDDSDTFLHFVGANDFRIVAGGKEYLSATHGDLELCINEGGQAHDFRVEGDTDTHLLFVDGSADKVGIGTASPSYKLDVFGHDAWVQASGVIVGASGIVLDSDSSAIKFGDDQEITLTHAADSGLTLKHDASGDNKPFLLTLATGATSIVADEVLAKIAFQAPNESQGGDGASIAAAIQAVAEATFGGSANKTRIEFMTGASEAATTKAVITNAGHMGIGTTAPGHKLDVFGHDAWVQTSGIRIGASGIILDGTAVTASVTELNYVDGVTSAVQTQLDAKQASLTFGISNTNAVKVDSASAADDEYARFTANGLESRSTSEVLSDIGAQASIGGAASTVTSSDLTASRALVSNGSGKIAVSSTTSTELGYIDVSTLGTAEASKALTLDSNKKFTGVKDGTFNQADSWVTASGVHVGPSGVVVEGSSGSGISVKAQGTFGDYTLMLPSGNGTNGQVLTTDSKNTYWSTVSGGGGVDTTGTPANDQVAIFTDADTLEGDSDLQFDGTNLGIGADPSYPLHIDVDSNDLIYATATGRTGNSRVRFISGDGDNNNTLSLHLLSGPEASSYIYMGDTDDPDNGFIRYKNTGSANQMHFRTNAKDKMIIASDGRIGLGAGQGASTATVGHIDVVAHSGCIMASGIRGCLETSTDQAVGNFDIASSTAHNVVLGGNRTLAVKNTRAGDRFILRLTQDGGGNRTVTWFSTIKWAGGSAPTLTTTGSKADVVGFLCTGTNAFDGFVIGQNI